MRRRRRRCPHHQRWGQLDQRKRGLVRAFLRGDETEELARRNRTHLPIVNRDRGERWEDAVDEPQIVVSGDREVVGNRDPPVAKRVVAAESNEVISCDDGRELPTGVEKAFAGDPTRLYAECLGFQGIAAVLFPSPCTT